MEKFLRVTRISCLFYTNCLEMTSPPNFPLYSVEGLASSRHYDQCLTSVRTRLPLTLTGRHPACAGGSSPRK